jgi:hypothetical protein
MKRLQFVVLLIGLFAAVPAFAQSKDAKSDPVSGTWAGELQLGHANGPYEIQMVLKFDGSSAVTGTFTGLPSPGDVKKGTFDPKTGALKLQLGKTGNDAVLITMEGTVAKNKATGKVDADGGAGTFSLSRKE